MENQAHKVKNLMRTLQAVPYEFSVFVEEFGSFEELMHSPFMIKKLVKIKLINSGEELWVDDKTINSFSDTVQFNVIETKTVLVIRKEFGDD